MKHLLGITAFALIGAQLAACGGGSATPSVQPSACGSTSHGASESRVRYKDASVADGELCQQEVQERTCNAGQFGSWSGSFAQDTCRVEGKSGCDGKPHGASEERVRFDVAAAPVGGQCNEENQKRECDDGVWTAWSGTYGEAACVVSGKASCDGQPHATKQTQTRYEAAMVPSGSQCKEESQTRECNDGKWTDWLGTYAEVSCVVADKGSCDGKPHGSSEKRDRYEAASVPFGNQCRQEEQTRSCDDGSWSNWSGSYAAEGCAVVGAASCGDKPHGSVENRVRFAAAMVEKGSQCSQETQARQCQNGTWSNWSGGFSELECFIEGEAPCNGKPHGSNETRKRYEQSSVPFGGVCKDETQMRSCSNGVWSSWSGNNFSEEACRIEGPAPCGDKPHGSEESRSSYEQSGVRFGGVCKQETQTRACDNGNWSEWSGTLVLTCTVGDPAPCGDTPHGGAETRKRYEQASVAFGSVCAEQTQTRTCYNGTWSDWNGAFTFENCNVEPDNRPYSCKTSNGINICMEGDVYQNPAACGGIAGRGCPVTDAVSRCDYTSGNQKFAQVIYSTAGFPTASLRASAQQTCTSVQGVYQDL